MRWISAVLVAVIFSIGIVGGARGNTIDIDTVVSILVGHTWHGTNAQGEEYWFRHFGGPESGDFAAKFTDGDKVLGRADGTWSREENRLCWHWPGRGETFCYVRFEHDGNRLIMTRQDGVVHGGVISAGKPADW